MKKILLAPFIPLLVFTTTSSWAENKNDLRKFELDKEYHFSNSTERHSSPTKEIVLIKSQDQKNTQQESDFGMKPLGIKNSYIVKLKLACIDKQLPVTNIPSNKKIKWSLNIINSQELSGETLTDNQGLTNITITTKENLNNKKLRLELKEATQDVDLNKGPFEIFFPLEACKK